MDVSLVRYGLELVKKLNLLADFALEEIKQEHAQASQRPPVVRGNGPRCRVHKGFVEDCCGSS